MKIVRHETQRERWSGFAQSHTATSSDVKASSVLGLFCFVFLAHGRWRCVVTLQRVNLARWSKISQLPFLNVSH